MIPILIASLRLFWLYIQERKNKMRKITVVHVWQIKRFPLQRRETRLKWLMKFTKSTEGKRIACGSENLLLPNMRGIRGLNSVLCSINLFYKAWITKNFPSYMFAENDIYGAARTCSIVYHQVGSFFIRQIFYAQVPLTQYDRMHGIRSRGMHNSNDTGWSIFTTFMYLCNK